MNADKGFRTIASFKTNAISTDTPMNADNALRTTTTRAVTKVEAYANHDAMRCYTGQRISEIIEPSAQHSVAILRARSDFGGLVIQLMDDATMHVCNGTTPGTGGLRLDLSDDYIPFPVRYELFGAAEDDDDDELEDIDVEQMAKPITWRIRVGMFELAGQVTGPVAFDRIIAFFLGDALKQSAPRIRGPTVQPQFTLPVTRRISIGWFRSLNKWGIMGDGVLLWTCTDRNRLADVLSLWNRADWSIDVHFHGFTARLDGDHANELMSDQRRVSVLLSDYEKHGSLQWHSDAAIVSAAGYYEPVTDAYNPHLYYQTMIATARRLASSRPDKVTLRIWSKRNPDVQLEIGHGPNAHMKLMWSVRSIPPAPEGIVIGPTSTLEPVAKWCAKEFTAAWMYLPPALIPRGSECIIQIV